MTSYKLQAKANTPIDAYSVKSKNTRAIGRLLAGQVATGSLLDNNWFYAQLPSGVMGWMDKSMGIFTIIDSTPNPPPPNTPPVPEPLPEKDIEVAIHVSPITGIITVSLKMLGGKISRDDIALIINDGEIVI